MVDLSKAEQFALDQLVERETAEQQALQAKFAARFKAFAELVSEEHNIPVDYLRYDGSTQQFHDARVELAERAAQTEGVVKDSPPPRRPRRKDNGHVPEEENVVVDVSDIVPTA